MHRLIKEIRGVPSHGALGVYAPDESNQWVICPPSRYAPDEIRDSIFLPLMKKALMEGIGGRRQN